MSFQDIYGHEKQIRILQTSVMRNRVPHAYLFYGMRGVGKRTVAEAFAKALNCETQRNSRTSSHTQDEGSPLDESNSTSFDSCDNCSSCVKTDRKNHPDVVTIKADGQFIRIKEIRDAQEQMKFAPLEGGMRIFLMVDADRMNIYSANALLKTLEEPSLRNLLILITSSPHQLPATILSRCQQVRFNPLRRDTIVSFLRDRLSMEPERANAIASSSGGSIGKALEMSDDSYLALRDEIINGILQTDNTADPLRFLSMVSRFGKEREDIADSLNMLMTGYRDALVYKETGDEDGLINQHCTDIIKSIARGLSGRDILHNIKSVDWAMHTVDQNANKQLTLEVMLFKLIRHRK
jgi:DNA polymerase-3 subunit delta'